MSNSVDVTVKRAGDGWECEVLVDQAGQNSRHAVRVTPADVGRWARGDGDQAVEELVRRSFAFLLEREPASSILRRFDLSVIESYFPEYDRELRG